MREVETVNQEQPKAASGPGFRQELATFWAQVPYKSCFGLLLLAWLALFQFLGNSTLGYVDQPSLFSWLSWMYANSGDDAHGRYVPFLVLGLVWWKRGVLQAVAKRPWWPALVLVVLGLLLHGVGYAVQQTQISVVGFFVGLYGLMGLVWGPAWLGATFFPFCLFAFCLPVGNVTGPISFHLRLLATKITAVICQTGLGIDVVHTGTRLMDPMGIYEYEVAAACSGIRSLTATLALATVYAFVMLRVWWRRALMMAAALPLAVAANVVRLSTIIVAAEAFGQKAGNFVHHSSWLSLLPYVPAIIGILVLGHWLREDRARKRPEGEVWGGVEQGL